MATKKAYPSNLAKAVFSEESNMIRVVAELCEEKTVFLNEVERTIIRYRFKDEKTREQIAEKLGMSKDDVLTIEAKGVRKLRSFIINRRRENNGKRQMRKKSNEIL